jgi:hypothetical protein
MTEVVVKVWWMKTKGEFRCYNLSGSQNYPTLSPLLKSEYIEPRPPSNKSTLLLEKEKRNLRMIKTMHVN